MFKRKSFIIIVLLNILCGKNGKGSRRFWGVCVCGEGKNNFVCVGGGVEGGEGKILEGFEGGGVGGYPTM